MNRITENNNNFDIFVSGGNGCGHNPANPRWFLPPENHKERPRILGKLSEKIRAYYHDPEAILPSLNLANGSERKQRSERREACLQILSCLTHYLDLVTLRVGIPWKDGSFGGISMERIATLCGIGLRRAERAIRDLVAAGIITVHPIAKQSGLATYTGYPAIRTISTSLFKAFGLSKWLRHERDKASRRHHKQKRREEPIGRLELIIKAAEAKKTQHNQTRTPEETTPQKSPPSQDPRSAIAHLKKIVIGKRRPP
ncbi:hypothetical protein Noc_A0039 (plasmid) [Nitrosococcus oceani ATCC 19707]|uniref:Uncharacterized protein n=2 Tax=Nitrosococcus oceani TaxID=1229 RepID=Q3JF44_NITOC|nr:hypothetical protein [Nitrosococcus oceani]ABA56552.1 hypothetical protein Noc_A0039 [Nitrosococcus oceani ATCC 19707]EDZ65211.1 hypothetical protein NOC27_3375 [Nitrosococcus oceani AFC27]KFI17773.1 hypothetical protein IB75_18615 [Nitrosococcus oceani C-27]BBM60828.1 hypothetical protein NONS58_P0420 [Nitrosococcus oceani]